MNINMHLHCYIHSTLGFCSLQDTWYKNKKRAYLCVPRWWYCIHANIAHVGYLAVAPQGPPLVGQEDEFGD